MNALFEVYEDNSGTLHFFAEHPDGHSFYRASSDPEKIVELIEEARNGNIFDCVADIEVDPDSDEDDIKKYETLKAEMIETTSVVTSCGSFNLENLGIAGLEAITLMVCKGPAEAADFIQTCPYYPAYRILDILKTHLKHYGWKEDFAAACELVNAAAQTLPEDICEFELAGQLGGLWAEVDWSAEDSGRDISLRVELRHSLDAAKVMDFLHSWGFSYEDQDGNILFVK